MCFISLTAWLQSPSLCLGPFHFLEGDFCSDPIWTNMPKHLLHTNLTCFVQFCLIWLIWCWAKRNPSKPHTQHEQRPEKESSKLLTASRRTADASKARAPTTFLFEQKLSRLFGTSATPLTTFETAQHLLNVLSKLHQKLCGAMAKTCYTNQERLNPMPNKQHAMCNVHPRTLKHLMIYNHLQLVPMTVAKLVANEPFWVLVTEQSAHLL